MIAMHARTQYRFGVDRARRQVVATTSTLFACGRANNWLKQESDAIYCRSQAAIAITWSTSLRKLLPSCRLLVAQQIHPCHKMLHFCFDIA
jgi:hypothetical protein